MQTMGNSRLSVTSGGQTIGSESESASTESLRPSSSMRLLKFWNASSALEDAHRDRFYDSYDEYEY